MLRGTSDVRGLPGLLTALLLAGLLGLSGHAAAQSPFDLALTPGAIAFPQPGAAEFQQGSVSFENVTLQVDVQGFAIWVLRLQSEDPDLGVYGKPIEDLEWRLEGSGGWQPMSASGQVVTWGLRSRRLTLHFRMNLALERDVPGDYMADLRFTVESLFGYGSVEMDGVPDGAVPAPGGWPPAPVEPSRCVVAAGGARIGAPPDRPAATRPGVTGRQPAESRPAPPSGAPSTCAGGEGPARAAGGSA